MVEAAIFIPLMIVAVTQMVKMFVPAISGGWTLIVAFVVGALIALFDTTIGVVNITVAQGLLLALEAVGISTVAAKAGGGACGDENAPR